MNSLDARTPFTNIRRQLSGFVVVAAVAMMSLVMAPSAHATIGTCDTAGPVEVEATGAGPGPTAYATLAAAVTAINAGTHTGAINVEICASTTETAAMFLNSSGAGSASYTSILIRPLADGLTVSGPTVTGRGLIELNGADNVTIDGDNPNSGGTNRNLTITNTAVATVVANSVIRIATTTTTVTSADNNTIKNLILNGNVTAGNAVAITSTTGSSGVSFGIVAGGAASGATTAPTALAAAAGTAAPSGTTINNLTIDNNAINQCARGVQFNGAATTVATALTVTNNTVGASGAPLPAIPPYTSPTSTVYGKGIAIQGTNALTVTGNTIQNVISYVGIAMAGVETTTLIGTGTITISNNAISTVVLNSTASIPARGIASLVAGAAYTVKGNTISDVENFSGSATNQPNGILVSSTGGAATVDSNTVTKVYNRGTGTFGAQGITLNGGNNHIVKNNFVSDVNQVITGGASFDVQFGVAGIRVNSGTGHKIYHNTVNMFGATLGSAAASNLMAAFGITTTGLTGCDVRNNIFSNTMTGAGATSAYVAVFLPSSGTTANMNLTLNNNAYYTGSTAGLHGVAAVGTTYQSPPAGATTYQGLYTAGNFVPSSSAGTTNFRFYTNTLSAAATNDNASFASTAAAPFVSSTNLHISSGSPSPLESGGVSAGTTGVAVDIDNQARPGPAGSVNGGATAPDLGADEFDGFPLLANDIQASAFVDPTNGGTKIAGVAFSPQAAFNNAGTATQTSVTVRYRILNNLAVEVYNNTQVIASIAPAANATVTFASTTLSAGLYTIKAKSELVGDQATGNDEITGTLNVESPLCGDYTVGSGGVYTSLTNVGGAFDKLNSLGATCDVSFSIISDLTGETGGIALNQVAGGWATLIRPSGAARVVTGTGTGGTVIKLNGADKVTIDGSLTAFSGTDRSLTISNPNTSSGVTVVWIGSIGVGAGAANNTVKNCVIQNGTVGSTSVTNFGIFVGDTTGAANGNDNDNLTIQNNRIIKTTIGIQAIGAATGLNDNPSIVDNTIGDPVTASSIGRYGMNVGQSTGATIARNLIQNVVTVDPAITGSNNSIGMILSAGLVNSTITRNTVTGIKYTSTAGYSGKGIDINTGVASSNLTITNNSVTDIRGDGWNTLTSDSIVGIRIQGTTGNIKLYNNSVNLGYGTFAGNTSGTLTASLFVASSVTALDIRNNIFANNLDNTATAADKMYTIATDATTNSLFTTINKNDYFPSAPAGKVGLLNSVDRNDLAAWQTASGQDGLSKQVDPKFTSPTDIHLNVTLGPSPVENSGDSIGAVTDDIDGNTRGSVPDLGADEVDTCFGVICTPFNTACATASCDPAGLSGNCSVLAPLVAGTECRASAGICDVAEQCDGSSTACPADAFQLGTECRGSAGVCDVAETCTGASAFCPADGFNTGLECRPSAGVCDVAESCNGSGASCPADGYNTGFQCRPSAGACDLAESCDGSGVTCPADVLVAGGTECRGSAGVCDVAESCTGSSPLCPADGFNTGFECRPAAGVCDVAESCDGSGASCPADVLVAGGTECRGSAGVCDVAESCTGSDPSCPADGYNTGSECRPSAGVCDVAESCDGSGASCPADGFVAGGTECRGSAGVCDVAESCTGSSASCPADGFNTGFECRPSAGQCDVAESCDGSGVSCPADGFATAVTGCTGTANGGACDNDPADHCSGTDNTCVDAYQAGGFECRASAGQCDVAETCSGSSSTCPADAFALATASCTGTINGGACDNDAADHCTGTDNSCVDVYRAAGFECRPSVGACDVAETCDGSSSTCPADVVATSATSCVGTANGGACDNDAADHCTGTDTNCVDVFRANTFTCRASVGSCDVAESCTGSSSTCPADVLVASGTSCRPSTGACDPAETCNGSSGFCPADVLGGPVTVLSSTGTAAGVPTNYATLGPAFAAINAGGTHTGAIAITICSSISEGATPATLNSSGAGSASYTSVSIRPAAPGITVTGNPVTGFGVVQLNGADNVTIDGDDPNTPGINRDLTISNTAAAAVTANSAVRIAVSTTGVTSADNDTIKNCNLNGNVTGGNAAAVTSTTGSAAVSFGIFAGGGGGASAIGAPVALPVGTPAGTSAPAGTTINNLTIDNNAVTQAARAVAFNGTAAANSTGVTVTNNTIGTAGVLSGAPPYTSPTSTVYQKGVVIQGANVVNVSNNAIQNVLSYIGIAQAGVELTSVVGTGPNVVSGNVITGVVCNVANGVSVRGLSILASAGAYTLGGNTITNVQNFNSSTTITNQPNGIFVNTAATSATIENNKVTTIYDRNPGTDGVAAVHLSGGNNITFRNNFVSDVNEDMTGGIAFSTTFGVFGVRITTGTGHKVYHNSVNLFGPLLGTANSSILSAAFAITTTTAPIAGIDVRNNIFTNTMTGGTTSIAHVATFLPASGTTANLNLTWNNNAYYTGTTAGVHGVCHVGTTYTAVPAGPATWAGLYTAANFSSAATTPNSNLRAYTSTLSAGGLNDNQSLASSSAAPFTTSTNLHLNTGLSPTALESHGAAIGVVSDIDGDVRPGPAGSVNGGATAPDLGADEFDGVPPLANDIQATAFVDPTNGGTKAAGAAFSPQASFTNNGTASQTGVTVRYRILDAGSFEVYNNTQSIASILSGATTTVTFASTSLPAGPYTIKAKAELVGDQVPANDEITGSLVVEAPLCGNYNVGSGGAFTSLTNAGGAFSKLNALGASCSVTFSIISDLTGETGTVAVGQWAEFAGSGYTLTIKPSGGVRSISGDSSTAAVRALIRLDGADRVTIDGSLTGTDRSLTIVNADLSTASAVINVSSGAAGAQNDTVKNTIVVGSSNTATFIGIGFGGATVASLGTDNDNNRVENCDIRKVQFGIAAQGATAANKDLGTVITKNLMNSTGTNSIGRGAIVASFEDGIQITDNVIGGIVNGASVDAFGISLGGLIGWGNTTTTGGSEVTNAVVTGNKIGTVQQTNTFSAAGIVITPATTGTNKIANNFISGVIANGTAPDFGAGIFLIDSGTDSTTQIYHNSISMVGTLAASDQPQYALAVAGTNPTLDVRNNILRNVQSTGTTTISYAIGLGYSAFTNLTSDNNDLFVTATGNFRIGRTVSITSTGGSDAATLANWQTATGKDAASKNVAPNFVSDTDLHLDLASAATAIENAGVFLAAVPNDIDGDTRDNPAPDIGADELHCHTSVPAENCNDGSVCSIDTCSPVTGCVYTPGNGGTECRAAAGFCDVAESCNGSSAACPADGFVTGGTECRGSAGICDVAESCTGLSAFCPADGFVTGGTECRGSAGACDPAEACTGSQASCPADLLADSSTVCRGAVGTCDNAENCTGSSPTCPADAVVTAGTECRASAGDCDLAESCDGFVGTCPADAFRPSSYECRASTATCDPAENCTGSSASCPADAVNQSAPVGPTVTASQSGPTTTITWTESLAGPFNVYRGSITSGAAFSYNHACYANGVPGPSVTDPSDPTPGKLWYYLISRQQTPCSESNLGQDGSGADRPNAFACGSGTQDGDVDGVADDIDNCPTVSNASQDDADSDKHGDVCDNCVTTANVDQGNADGDALGDACDPDIDNDGFANGVDNCPYAANDQTDTDGDGIGDACDDTP